MSLPIIPTFRFCSSSRSLPSAFTPYLQEPLFHQMHDEVYYELAGQPRTLGGDEKRVLVKKEEKEY